MAKDASQVPALPLELDGKRLAKRTDPPRIGEHGRELLARARAIHRRRSTSLRDRRIVALP